MIQTECTELFTEHFPFWEKLSAQEKELLCENTSSAKYEKGANIHGGMSNCTGVLLVKSGCLRTYMLSEEGKEITLYRLYPGDVCVLSVSCILETITFDVFVDAEEQSELYIINPSTFSQVSQSNMYVENFAYKLAAVRFSDVMWAMQQILFMSFDQRLAVFLNDELAKTGGDTVNMTHEQIAKYMGSAREVVSRMLKYFVEESIVKLTRGGITVIDKNKLKSLI